MGILPPDVTGSEGYPEQVRCYPRGDLNVINERLP